MSQLETPDPLIELVRQRRELRAGAGAQMGPPAQADVDPLVEIVKERRRLREGGGQTNPQIRAIWDRQAAIEAGPSAPGPAMLGLPRPGETGALTPPEPSTGAPASYLGRVASEVAGSLGASLQGLEAAWQNLPRDLGLGGKRTLTGGLVGGGADQPEADPSQMTGLAGTAGRVIGSAVAGPVGGAMLGQQMTPEGIRQNLARGETLDPVSKFVADLAAMPASMLEPKAIAALLVSHRPAGAVLDSAYTQNALMALRSSLGPRVAGAVQAELAGAVNLGAFTGTQAAIEGQDAPGVLEQGAVGAEQGLVFGAPGAAGALMGRARARGVTPDQFALQREALDRMTPRNARASIAPEQGGSPDVQPPEVAPQGAPPSPPAAGIGDQAALGIAPRPPEQTGTPLPPLTPDPALARDRMPEIPAPAAALPAPSTASMPRADVIAELKQRGLPENGTTKTLRARLDEARAGSTQEPTDASAVRENAGQVPSGGPADEGRQSQGRQDLQRPAEVGAATGEQRAGALSEGGGAEALAGQDAGRVLTPTAQMDRPALIKELGERGEPVNGTAKVLRARLDGARGTEAPARSADSAGLAPEQAATAAAVKPQQGPQSEGVSPASVKPPATENVIHQKGSPRKPSPFSQRDLERRLIDEHASMTGESATLESEARGVNVSGAMNYKGPTMPLELKLALEGRPELRRLFRAAKGTERAGWEDVRNSMGEDRYWSWVADVAGRQRDKASAAAEALRNSPDPQHQFLAAVYENLPPGRRPDKITKTPGELEVGQTFKINGEHFEVLEHENGYRVLKDGEDYPVVPVDALDAIPMDKGSLKGPPAKPKVFESAKLRKSTPRNLLGEPMQDATTGSQRELVIGTETKPAGDVSGRSAEEQAIADKFKAAEENTPGLPGLPDPGEDGAEPVTGGVDAAPSHAFSQPRTMPGKAKAQVSAPEIIKAMENMTGVPIRTGHGLHSQRQAAGWFSRDRQVIRNRSANDLATAAHEVGHSIHDKLLNYKVGHLKGDLRRELIKMGRELYGSRKPNGGYIREGMAEYVARYMLGDDMAKAAPHAHDYFQKTLLPAHPEFAKKFAAIKGMFESWDQQGAPGRVAAQINRVGRGPVAAAKRGLEHASKVLSRSWWTNDAQPLEAAEARLLKETGKAIRPDQSPSKLRAALKMGAPGTARNFIFRAAVDTGFRPVGRSLSEVLQPVKGKMDDFLVYAYARRAQVLLERGINPGITKVDADFTVKDLHSPAFDAAVKGVTEWSGFLMDYLVDSGGLSAESAKAIRAANPIYLPLQRFFDDSKLGGSAGSGKRGVVNQGSAIKKIKGSGREIIDPIEALAQQAENMIRLGNKLQVAKAIADLAESAPGSAWFAEKLPPDKVPTTFKIEEIRKDLEAMGLQLPADAMEETATVFADAQRYFGKDNIVTITRNGKREFWELDPDIYRVVTDMDKEHLPGWLMAIVGPPKRLVQLGATGLNAGFSLVRNPIRDAMTFMIFSRAKRPQPLAQMEGLWERLRDTPTAALWRAAGGEMQTLMGQDRAATVRYVEESLARTPAERGWQIIKHPLDASRAALGLFEASPRIVEFKKVLAQAEAKYGKGSRAATIEALLASKDVTVDFTRSGVVGGALNSMIPFFNARVQGAAKFYRVFGGTEGRGRALQATARAVSYITLPSLALWWMNKDEEWYKELPKYRRLGFWNVSLDHGKTVVSIPKPFDLGYVFGSLPEAMMERAYSGDKQLVNDALFQALNSFLPAPLFDKGGAAQLLPALIKPSIETAFNYDSFRNRPIVPTYEAESKPPAEQYDQYATEMAKTVGKWLGVSPRKVEHWAGAHTGGMALDIARTVDTMTGHRKRDAEPVDLPVVGTLFARRGAQTRSVEEFYAALEQAKQRAGAEDATRIEKNRANQLEDTARRIGEVRERGQKQLLAQSAVQERIKFLAGRALDRGRSWDAADALAMKAP